MEDESHSDGNEYKKLPTEEKCVHKLWKARVAGYEEAAKLFNQIDDEKSPEWSKYVNLIKKFVADSNAVAQEKGLEATLIFAENCGHAGKTTGEVISNVVTKCIAAPKTKTKDLALQVTLMYIEIEKQDAVLEELIKGMDHKNPKIVTACISATTTALRQFGNKVVAIKPLVKKIPVLLADRDKGVRDEMKSLVVEMHRWIGPAIEPHIASLQPVVQQELREAFGNSEAPHPTRYLRSQQTKMAEAAVTGGDEDAEDEEDGEVGGADVADLDPYEMMDPVEILSKIPKDFYEKLESSKWQERKEALDALEAILKAAPKLEGGDYADLVRALKKMISKDTNVMLVALAGRLLGGVASGLRNKFQPYAVACVQAILEKFKEKKTNVVAALREAIDAIYPSTNLEAIMEDVLAAFENKNPSVKSETALFLARNLAKTQPAVLNKKLLKAYIRGLLKLLESADPTVRDASAEALGVMTKLVGEKNVAPHIGELDNLKQQKIKEFAEKAVIQVKTTGPKKEAKPKSAPKPEAKSQAGSTQPKPIKKPAAAGVKKVPVGTKKPASGKASSLQAREPELSQEEVDERSEELFGADVVAGLADTNWKSRLTAIQSVQCTLQGLSAGDASPQVLLRAINKKPGLKDTNVQVLKARLDAVKYVADNMPLSATSVEFVLQDVLTKLGEASCGGAAADALTALAEASRLEHVTVEALNFAMDQQRNPKVQAELFNWLGHAIKEFGFTMNVKPLIAHSKKAISATNPAVRSAAINFLGVLSLYVGPSLISHFDSEKAALKQLISLELDKYANNSPPSPTRGVSKSASKGSLDDLEEGSTEDPYDEEPAPVVDNRPLTDIAPLITEALLTEINDKNWKVRNEALEKLKGLITSSAPIKSSLGELPQALAARLLDSNSKLAQTTIQICESLAAAMGPRCKNHVRTFLPGFIQAFGDNKAWIRQAAVSCVEAWCRHAGGAHVVLDGEIVHDALKTGSPQVRAELFQWLADNLPNVAAKSFPREELTVCLPVLYACVEDRAAEVRKKAADCVLPFMLHLGYEPMHKALDKLKPGSKNVVQAALDKARPSLPVQPLPKAKKEDPKTVKSGGAQKKEGERKGSANQKAKGVAKQPSANKSKKDDEDNAPLLPQNNLKNQRIIDDQKLKVLKWNFVTPREEFFELLKEQMTTAGLNKQLIANMFHNDFRYHLKAIEALFEDLPENGSALTANLDLVLKWLTLRFFDTNPSVILKGLEYLSAVFNHLIESDYTMAEYEANCFIPYLVLKVGDPKDAVRNAVKSLFKQICVVYSVTKLFGYLMDGLKSKNARQRAECLECIGHLVETYGSTVMGGAAGPSLKELARHIGDRDNAVRSGALNCIASAYFLEGEKIYKMIGNISDKDLSLLEERIKRAAKTRSAENRRSMILPLSATGKPITRQPSEPDILEVHTPNNQISVENLPGADYEDEPYRPPVNAATYVKKGKEVNYRIMPNLKNSPSEEFLNNTAELKPEPKVVTGPFGLDPDLIAQLDSQIPKLRKCNVPELDVQFLDEPVQLPPNFRSNVPLRNNFGSPRRMTATHAMSTGQGTPAPAHHADDALLADTIHNLASPNLNVATRAMMALHNSLLSGRVAPLASHEDALLRSLAQQIAQLRASGHPVPDAAATYRHMASLLTVFYEVANCGMQAGSTSLAQILSELLRVLGGPPAPADPERDRLVRVFNNVCVKLLDRSEHTALLCALMDLLHDTIGVTDPAHPRYQELLLKCFWKTLKIINSWDVASINYDTVIYKIHVFYKTYPNAYWKKNAEMSDTPYRTVKTLVHTLVKFKGPSIMNHLTQIPDAHESDLYAYLHKVLKQLNQDKVEPREKREAADLGALGVGVGGALTTISNVHAGGARLPRHVHDELAQCLKRIGTKEQSREGLAQLYDLRERHPNVDIWTYMQGSSFYFRNYVERGLKEVAEKRHMFTANVDLSQNINIDGDTENGEQNHLVFLERLRALQAKAGLKADANSQPRTPIIDNKTLTDSMNENTLPKPHSIDPQFDLHPSQPSQRNEPAFDALRLKLQQIKSSSKR